MTYVDLASVRGVIDLTARQVLISAEDLLTSLGYNIVQRHSDAVVVNRRKGRGFLGHSTVSLAVIVEAVDSGGVKVKVRGDDQEGVQEQQVRWQTWADSLPRLVSEAKQPLTKDPSSASEPSSSKSLRRVSAKQKPKQQAAAIRKKIELLQAELKDLTNDKHSQEEASADFSESETEITQLKEKFRSPYPSQSADSSKQDPRAEEEASSNDQLVKKVIEAQEFRLVDQTGQLRATLGIDDEDDVTRFGLCDRTGSLRAAMFANTKDANLAIVDNQGDIRVRLGVGENGPALDLTDDTGTVRCRLNVNDEGANLVLIDQDGTPRVGLQEDEEGRFLLGFLDSYGVTRATLHIDYDGSPKLVMRDGTGIIRSLISTSDKEINGIGLFDRNEKLRASLVVSEDGSPTVALSDGSGTPRAMIISGSSDEPAFILLDKFGNPIRRVE